MTDNGYIFDIKKYSINDGPGIRTTVFMKGCPLNCTWCHNPESHNMKPETIETTKRWTLYSHSESQDKIGKLVSAEEVFDEIRKDIPFYNESGGGVTFSGGEPMLQTDFLRTLLQMCKKENISTAVDTCGYTEKNNFMEIYDLTDLFLYDLKIINEVRHIELTGVSNTIIIDNLRALAAKGDKVILRIPVVPGINDTEDNLNDILSLITSLKQLRQINLLPFHNSAEGKYKRIHKDYIIKGVTAPSKSYMEDLRNKFSETGIPVYVGG